MLVPEGLLGLHRTVQLQLLSITGWGIDLDDSDIEWFALKMNKDHSFIFEIASRYCISTSFVDYYCYSISFFFFFFYSISSKVVVVLPTVVDIMVI